jgi:pimeloyl-ACP methyl ester carboxylesterase
MAPVVRGASCETQEDSERVFEVVAKRSFNNPVVPKALIALARRLGRRPLPKGTDRQLRAADACHTTDRLHLIQAPTLVITGDNDQVFPPSASKTLAERIPDARLTILEGAPHALNFVCFRRFNRTVLQFLQA